MKIVCISTPIFRMCPPAGTLGYGGLEPLAWQIAYGLAKKGHQVSLIGPDGTDCPGATVVAVGPEKQVDELGAFERYKSCLAGADAVIDHTWLKCSYLMKADGKLKAPVLGVCHAPINTMYQRLPPKVEKPCFVCISRDQALHFEGTFGRDVRWCWNGVDTSYYRPLAVPRTDRFLFLARFSTIKGPDLAIEACNRLNLGLDLIGDTQITNEPDYIAKCKAMTDGRRIRIVGNQPRGACVWWLSQAFAMLHPNQRFREPFGLAPVESMLCGTPVIAWRYGAMRETIKHGESGFLVDSAEGMAECMGVLRDMSDHDMAAMRARCREWACQFSVEKMVDRYEKLCQEAVDTGGW